MDDKNGDFFRATNQFRAAVVVHRLTPKETNLPKSHEEASFSFSEDQLIW
jgi:hypothetical protein